jgi:hypothetical protein
VFTPPLAVRSPWKRGAERFLVGGFGTAASVQSTFPTCTRTRNRPVESCSPTAQPSPRHFTYWPEPAVRAALESTGWEVLPIEHVAGRTDPWLLRTGPGRPGRRSSSDFRIRTSTTREPARSWESFPGSKKALSLSPRVLEPARALLEVRQHPSRVPPKDLDRPGDGVADAHPRVITDAGRWWIDSPGSRHLPSICTATRMCSKTPARSLADKAARTKASSSQRALRITTTCTNRRARPDSTFETSPIQQRTGNATPSVLHQRHIGRVLRSSCDHPGRRRASSRDREPRAGRCPAST